MEKWFVTMKKADFQQIAGQIPHFPDYCETDPKQGYNTIEEIDYYLNGTIADLHDGMLMKDMDTAVKFCRRKSGKNEKIRVIGDYDIDGVNATYILQEGLVRLGANVDTDIPDRIKDGYGLNRCF